jgi:hypothetical protein
LGELALARRCERPSSDLVAVLSKIDFEEAAGDNPAASFLLSANDARVSPEMTDVRKHPRGERDDNAE